VALIAIALAPHLQALVVGERLRLSDQAIALATDGLHVALALRTVAQGVAKLADSPDQSRVGAGPVAEQPRAQFLPRHCLPVPLGEREENCNGTRAQAIAAVGTQDEPRIRRDD
jgi:hypothetical protein